MVFSYVCTRGVLASVPWYLAPEGVPIPTHIESLSSTGFGVVGGTSVVSAYKIRLLVGPRE
jgi:hypothetical protein